MAKDGAECGNSATVNIIVNCAAWCLKVMLRLISVLYGKFCDQSLASFFFKFRHSNLKSHADDEQFSA